MSKPTIGFIGLGIMGKPMAKNLVKAGYDVTVFDLKQASSERRFQHYRSFERRGYHHHDGSEFPACQTGRS